MEKREKRGGGGREEIRSPIVMTAEMIANCYDSSSRSPFVFLSAQHQQLLLLDLDSHICWQIQACYAMMMTAE